MGRVVFLEVKTQGVVVKKLLLAVLLVCIPGCVQATPAVLAPAMVASTVALSGADGKPYCTGVAISATRVMTAAHCLAKPELFVFAEGGTPKKAIVIWQNVERDAAELEVEGAGFTPARLGDSSTLRRGDQVFTVGNTYGNLTFSFAVGYVAFVGRSLVGDGEEGNPIGAFIQYQLETRGGNSGGPIFNAAGEVIAIHTRSDSRGVAFGVPINEAKPA
jgi:putative serine protease PepD